MQIKVSKVLCTNCSLVGNQLNPQVPKRGEGQMNPPIGFSDLKFEAFKESK